MQLPGEDRHNYSKEYLRNNMAVLMGGRVAEEVVLNQLTTGASNDIERATKTAHNMVCMWGMSEKLGPMSFGDNQEQVFLGRELIHNKNYGEETAKLIDSEVRRFVDEAHEKATALVKENRKILDAIAMALLERETITGQDIDLLMEGKELPPMEPNTNSGSGSSGSSGPGTPSGYNADGRATEAGPGYEPVSEKPDESKKPSGESGGSDDDFILDDGDGDGRDGDGGENKLQ
jgi:cell division protease FtsH